MSRVTMIQHINIQISDRERTREWYEKVLGAEFLDRGPTQQQTAPVADRQRGDSYYAYPQPRSIGPFRVRDSRLGGNDRQPGRAGRPLCPTHHPCV